MKYTHTFQPDSSVLSNVWYNSGDKKLVVQLHNGTIAGYEDVPLDVYNAFANQEALGASAGTYWNLWIKPHFTGFSTAGLYDEDDFEPEVTVSNNSFSFWTNPVENTATEQAFVDNEGAQEVGIGKFEQDQIDRINAGLPPLEDEKFTFNVEFSFEDDLNTYDENKLWVFAPDTDTAKQVFETVADALGYQEVVVTSITQYYV